MARAARPAIPPLISVLKNDESPLVRQFAVNTLATLSKSILERDVMDAWIQATHDKDSRVRSWAATQLKQEAPGVAIEAGIK